ncbi:MAG: hypothetical protein AAF557_13335 [Pseudomonadota bacterium]
MLRLILAWTFIFWSGLATAKEDAPWYSCLPAYCSLALTTELGFTNNVDRNGKHEDAPFATGVAELRADVVPVAYGVHANLSVLAILNDRMDLPGRDLGILIPQIHVWRDAFGLRWSVAYAPVIIFRDLFSRNTARLHEFNFGIKHIWTTPPFLLDSLDLRFEFKERTAEPDTESEHRFTIEAEAVEHFHIGDRKFRVWAELRAETGIRNEDRIGTRVAHKFTSTVELTTNLGRHVRLTIFKVRREDRAAGPRASDFGRWEFGSALRLKFNW